MSIPRYTPEDVIEDLREEATDLAQDLVGIAPEETTAGQTAQMLEEMAEALGRIAAGAENPREIAEAALRFDVPLKPIGQADPGDFIRDLLKPRRV